MSDNRNPATGDFRVHRESIDFTQDSALKVAEAFTAGRLQVWIFCNPTERVRLVSPFNLFPGKTFPLTKVDLPERRTHMAIDAKRRGDSNPCLMSSPQVTGINNVDPLFAKRRDQLC